MDIPPRLTRSNIQRVIGLLNEILMLSHGQDLRIAQVLGNLGDNYYLEDEQYIQHLTNAVMILRRRRDEALIKQRATKAM